MSWKLQQNAEFMENGPRMEVLEAENNDYDTFILGKTKSVMVKLNKNKITKKKIKRKKITPTLDCCNLEVNPSPAWLQLGVPTKLASVLASEGFDNPTEVQIKCIPELIKLKRDSIVASETGSGKTLVYIIPIIARCLTIQEEINDVKSDKYLKLRCLIITPTRELSIQVKNMVSKISKKLNIFCIDVIGGLSEIRQERQLNMRPQIVVGTPGRLWTYMEQYPNPHMCDLSGFKLLVIDEADRMSEKGHFFQLKNIIDFIRRKINGNYSTYIFSATLALQKNTLKFKSKKNESTFDKISNFIHMSKNYKIFDLSNSIVTPCSLKEYKILCDSEAVRLFLYCILRTSGKTIIFVNTIMASDWLSVFLSNLNINSLRLNSKMEQKCRLKLYDRFSQSNSILIATDVAARGLDIPNIQTVIHLSVPANPDLYVHRSGRTARQFRPGQSIMFVIPEHYSQYQQILATLKRSTDLSEYYLDPEIMRKYKNVVDWSIFIADESSKLKKVRSSDKWFKDKARESETIFDPSFSKFVPPDSDVITFYDKNLLKQKEKLLLELSKLN